MKCVEYPRLGTIVRISDDKAHSEVVKGNAHYINKRMFKKFVDGELIYQDGLFVRKPKREKLIKREKLKRKENKSSARRRGKH